MDVIYCSKSPAFCYRYLYIDSLRCGRPRRLIKLTENKGCIVFYTTLWVTATIITICCITAPSGVCIGGRLDVFFVFFCGDTKHLVCWLFRMWFWHPLSLVRPRSHIKKSPKIAKIAKNKIAKNQSEQVMVYWTKQWKFIYSTKINAPTRSYTPHAQ